MTRIITRSRRGGKTMEAIRLAAETGAYMVVVHAQEAMRVADLARSMGLDIRYPITFDEFHRTRMHGSHIRNVVLDNADEFLQRLFAGLTIEAATWTTTNPPAETDR